MFTKSRTSRVTSTSSALTVSGIALTALFAAPETLHAAAGTATSSIEEVVVTARFRDENAQDVPIALSVVDSDVIAATGAFTLSDMQQLAPSLQVVSFNPRNTNINIRGLGSNIALSNDGLESGVGFYIDNVYYGRSGQSQFDLIDLERLEILRGPQGTLFGKNTTAGAISITTRKPVFTPESTWEISTANLGYTQARGSISGPLLDDVVAYRVTLGHSERDGLTENVVTGKDVNDYRNITVRSQVLILPSDALEIRLIGDYSRSDANSTAQSYVTHFDTYDSGTHIDNNFSDRLARAGYTLASSDPFNRKVEADSEFLSDMESYGGSAQFDWDLNNVALTSISAYRWWDWNPHNDFDALGLEVLTKAEQNNRQRQFSQEFRLASKGNHTLDYVAGLYYLKQRNPGEGITAWGADAGSWYLPQLADGLANLALNGFRGESLSIPETTSYAAFTQFIWHLNDRLDFTTGLRYTYEDKQGSYRRAQAHGADLSGLTQEEAVLVQTIRNNFYPNASFTTAVDDDSFSWLLNPSYRLNNHLLTYASYSVGAKSGGLNLTNLPEGIDPQVDEETVSSIELGFKGQWLDGRWIFNTAIFQTEIEDYQAAITEILAGSSTFRQYIANTGAVRSRGVELDTSLEVADSLRLYASAAYTDASYLDYRNGQQAPENLDQGPVQDLSGEPLPGVPELSWNLGINATFPLDYWREGLTLYTDINYAHRDGYFTDVSNSRYSHVDDLGRATLRIGVRPDGDQWDISVWGKNVTDEDYLESVVLDNTGFVRGVVGEPKLIGATLRLNL